MVSEYEAERRLDKWADDQTKRERISALFHPHPNTAFLAALKKYGLMGNSN
jgi:hypothetical protein